MAANAAEPGDVDARFQCCIITDRCVMPDEYTTIDTNMPAYPRMRGDYCRSVKHGPLAHFGSS